MAALKKIPGVKVLFGGELLDPATHSIPDCYGSFLPTAVQVWSAGTVGGLCECGGCDTRKRLRLSCACGWAERAFLPNPLRLLLSHTECMGSLPSCIDREL
jgi:hypothetical protein